MLIFAIKCLFVAFIGYASQIYSIVSHREIENQDDDQLYYTKIYLDTELRTKFSIKLDLLSFLFQNLNGAINDVEIRFSQGNQIDETNADAFLFNKLYQTQPIIIHGNGNSKIPLNSLGNYLAKSWHPATGCLSCDDDTRFNMDQLTLDKYPHVLVAVNILKPTPFFTEFLQDVILLDYPKNRITLFIQSLTDFHSIEVEQFIDDNKSFYHSIRYISNEKDVEWQLRNRYLYNIFFLIYFSFINIVSYYSDECVRVGADYLFAWDSEARITNAKTLQLLMQHNKYEFGQFYDD